MRNREQEITLWKFRAELKTMALSCIGLKPNTVNRKVHNILKKYNELMSFDEDERTYYKKQYFELEKKFETLKSGVIEHTNGIILLKEVQEIRVNDIAVFVYLKGGREVKLSKGFDYLTDLYTYS